MSKNKITGFVSYAVIVECPDCKQRLNLTEYPYDVDSSHGFAEDLIGEAVFGTTTRPATWTGIDLDFTCCKCSGKFTLGSLET
jgi:hypothetical protein